MPDPTGASRAVDAVRSDLAQAERRLGDAEARAHDARQAARQEGREVEERSDRGDFDIDERVEDAAYAEKDRLQGEADDASRAVEDARAEVAELRAELGSLATDEDILGEVDDVNPEWGGSSNATKYRAAGAAMGLLGGVLLFMSLQADTEDLPPTAEATPTATATATATPDTRPTASPSSVAEVPVTGSADAIVSFTRTSGECPYAPEFDAGFRLESTDGVLTLIQVGLVEHVSSGSMGPDGSFQTAASDQTYVGQVDGTRVTGTYTDTAGDCNDVYQIEGDLLRPMLAPPPFDSAPGHFEFLDLAGQIVSLDISDVAGPSSIEVIVASQTLDVTAQLPITVVATSGVDTLFEFAIEGPPTEMCRGPDGCSAPVPGDPSWADPGREIMIVATGGGGDVIAVTMPHGAPATVEPTPEPTPTASPTPSPPASPTAQPQPSGSAASTTDPNVPLAVAGLALMAGGLGVGLGGPRIGRSRASGTSPMGSSAATVAAQIIAADVATGPLFGRSSKDGDEPVAAAAPPTVETSDPGPSA